MAKAKARAATKGPQPEVIEFKGHPVLRVPYGKKQDRFFQFGLSKAQGIVDSLKAVQEFVADHASTEE